MSEFSLKGADLSQETLTALCALRLSIVQLKPEIDIEQDFKKFCAFIRKSQYVNYAVEKGEIQAFFVTYYSQQCINRRKTIVVEPEFGFVRPAYRQNPFVKKAFAAVIRKIKLRYWYKPIFIVGSAYPHSFIAFMRQFAHNLWLLNSVDIAVFDKTILTDFLQRKTGKTAIDTGIVAVPTIHSEQNPEHLARLQKSPFYKTYLAENPNWQKGWTLAFIVRISWWALLKAIFKRKN